MLKPTSFKASLLALAMIVSSLMSFSYPFTTPASATGDRYDITNIREFCEYFKVESDSRVIWPTDECTTLTKISGGDTFVTFNRTLYVRGSDIVTIYGLDMTYNGRFMPIRIEEDGKLILDGVKMTSNDCLFIADYRRDKGIYTPTGIEIRSGVFTAIEGEVRSPFCAIYSASDKPYDPEAALKIFLAENSYYADVRTGRELVLKDGKDLGLGVHNFQPKDPDDKLPTYYINWYTILVLEREGRGEVEEPEPEPEPETPETPENPEPSEKPEVVIPKAPNTGSSK